MGKELTTDQLAEKISQQHAILEPIETKKVDKVTGLPTDEVARKDWMASIPETLLGINLFGHGSTQKEARADLAKRLSPILDSDDLDLADDWAKRHLK